MLKHFANMRDFVGRGQWLGSLAVGESQPPKVIDGSDGESSDLHALQELGLTSSR